MAAADLPVWLGLPGSRGRMDDASRTLASVDAWAHDAALEELVAAFGGRLPHGDAAERLSWLDDFSAVHWDFRAGLERNLARDAELTVAQSELVLALAEPLGLAGITVPRRSHYDTVLMTGGMIRAGIVKPRFAAELLGSGHSFERVVFLGGFRPFAGDEIGLAAVLGIHGDNEFDAMVAGMDAAFGPLDEPVVRGRDDANPNLSWRQYDWDASGVRLSVLAAPSSDPRRRANSVDTYRFWAEQRRAEAERSVLLVTTPIYVPYQGAAAVETFGLDHGLAVETVGTSVAANDLGEHSQPFSPGHHLQELRSAIRGMRSLRARLVREMAGGDAL
jgi:hypothetical protein